MSKAIRVEDEPPRRKKRKRSVFPRRMSWPTTRYTPDIDLMKPERLGGGFCGCGQRMVDQAVCMRCFDVQED